MNTWPSKISRHDRLVLAGLELKATQQGGLTLAEQRAHRDLVLRLEIIENNKQEIIDAFVKSEQETSCCY